SAVNRLNDLIPESYYNDLFPYRFGSEAWKNCSATKAFYPDPSKLPDYYSYQNLKKAIQTLSNTIIKVQWYEGSEWCYRIIRLNKTTKEQKLIFTDPSFNEEWIQNSKTLMTSVCDYGSFLAVGDLNTRKRELAGFLANISHETGGGSIDGVMDDSKTGLYFNEEVGFIGSSAIGYVQGSGTSYLPVAGKSYHGRGPIQLSYNYNYGLCSDVLFGDSSVLLKNPEKVSEDGVLGLMTGIWFWMTPQPPKPSCHQVITGDWAPKAGAPNEKYNKNFGLTIIIINNEAGQSETGVGAVARRARYYRTFAAKMGADISGEQCDTMGMTTFTQK
ncbi:MAG: chitinase, partial [Oscillospiraceae bacterium]